MRIVRPSVPLVGSFFVAAGILLGEYGQGQASRALVVFGALYAAAGAGMTAFSFKPHGPR